MNSDIMVRRAAFEDVPRLAEIEKICFSEPWSEAVFTDFLDRNGSVVLAAASEGTVVGYVTGAYVLDGADIYNIAVTADCRRKGVGDKLLREFFEVLPSDVKTVGLEVRESNGAAISMYRKNGFETVGIRKNFYISPRENAVLMTKQLTVESI